MIWHLTKGNSKPTGGFADKMTLFSKCFLPSIPHLLVTNVLLHFPSLHDDFDPNHWTSPFLDMLQHPLRLFWLTFLDMKSMTYHLALILSKLCTFQYHLVVLAFRISLFRLSAFISNKPKSYCFLFPCSLIAIF